MKYRTARSLYNHIGQKYHDNRNRASNDVTELPAVINLLGDLKGKQILDMGCGLGRHANGFIKRGAIVTGYDASEKMVALAKEYCGEKDNFFRSTHETASFEPNSFDICNASFSINYSKNLEIIFRNVHSWLKPGGVFTFSIPHPIWLQTRSENMDYSKPHKIWIEIGSYGVEIFNHYHPLDSYIHLINKYNFKLLNLVETTISKKHKGWPEYKYRLPNAYVFKLQKPVMVDNKLLHEMAITAIIRKGNKYLITKRAQSKKRFPGKWTVPGGKLEIKDYIKLPKDTEFYWYNVLERVLRREVKEEVGIKIKNIEYVTSLATVHTDGNPSLVISCLADYVSGKIKLQKDEADDFAWVSLKEAKKYDLIDGIYDELAMAENEIKGVKGEWKRT